MFPRISKSTKNGKNYDYLVISESLHVKGKGSTTRNIATLGNIKRFGRQDVANLIDGFIRIFKLENYCLSEDVQLLESLEHGSIIFWQKLWDELGLSKIIKSQVKLKDKRIKLEVDKYVQMMVINRCVDPLSKLGVTRWIERTCYKEMAGYKDLDFDVTYFYRSMDHLLTVKDDLELAIFEKLKDLFSINVKLTFYDITSSFFYTDNCEIGENGYSRDNRPEREQIVIGVVTTFEGYPIKHYVFEGNRKDETTVKQVVKELKSAYNISCDILSDLFQTSGNSFCICFSSGKLVPRLAPRLTVAHHEKHDGSGYNKVFGEKIPLEARVLAVADVYDSLTSDRPYRKAMSPFDAKDIIEKGFGTEFDPKVVEVFLKVFAKGELEIPNVVL